MAVGGNKIDLRGEAGGGGGFERVVEGGGNGYDCTEPFRRGLRCCLGPQMSKNAYFVINGVRDGGMTRRGQLMPAAQGEGTMGLEPDQGGGAGDCFVWFVAFVWGVGLGYGSPHSPPSMCFCRLERPLFTVQHTRDTRMWLSCWWPRKPIFRSRT